MATCMPSPMKVIMNTMTDTVGKVTKSTMSLHWKGDLVQQLYNTGTVEETCSPTMNTLIITARSGKSLVSTLK